MLLLQILHPTYYNVYRLKENHLEMCKNAKNASTSFVNTNLTPWFTTFKYLTFRKIKFGSDQLK